MNRSNININSPKGQMKYYVEYVDDKVTSSDYIGYSTSSTGEHIAFYSGENNLERDNNEWTKLSDDVIKSQLIGIYQQGSGVDELSGDHIPRASIPTYRHIAWADDKFGYTGVYTMYGVKTHTYMGVLDNTSKEDLSAAPEDYSWIYIGGVNNENLVNGNVNGHVLDLSTAEVGTDSYFVTDLSIPVTLASNDWFKSGCVLNNDKTVSTTLAIQLNIEFSGCEILNESRGMVFGISVESSSGSTVNWLSQSLRTTQDELNKGTTKAVYKTDIDVSYRFGTKMYIHILGLKPKGTVTLKNFKIEESTVGCTPFTYSDDDINKKNIYNISNTYHHVAWMDTLNNADKSFITTDDGVNHKYIGVCQDQNIEAPTTYDSYDWYYVGEEYYGEGLVGYNISKPSYNISSLNIYFPQFSVDTYVPTTKYALDVSISIGGVSISLCSKLLDRNDCMAVNSIKSFDHEEYFEYQNIKIIDPWYLVYGDEWKEFRHEVCGVDVTDYEKNNEGSLLNISIHPVESTSSYDNQRNIYIEIPGYHGGQNSVNIVDNNSGYLRFRIRETFTDNSDSSYGTPSDDVVITGAPPLIIPELLYNEAYPKTLEGLQQYMKETYRLDKFTLIAECVVQDDDDLYRYTTIKIDDPFNILTPNPIGGDDCHGWSLADILDSDGNPLLVFNNGWDDYRDGMYFRVILHICTDDTLDSSVMYLSSNKIILHKELFKYLAIRNVSSMSGDIVYPKYYMSEILTYEEKYSDPIMKIYNINTVNKIQQNVIQMERPADYKANIIKPVFFKVQPLNDITIHPDVTEQISIDLDAYKSKASSFMLKIEGVTFVEYGRSSTGVIFKIIGQSLPGTISEGTYYILNQDSELITSGKYTYEY